MFGVVAFVLLGFVSVHVRGVEEKIGPSYFWGFVVTAPRVYEWWASRSSLPGVWSSWPFPLRSSGGSAKPLSWRSVAI
jgi:hypothetical protein